MRNYVSKMFVGLGVANIPASDVAPEALTDGQIIAFDFDTRLGLSATSTNIGFAKGTAILGEPIIEGPIPVGSLEFANLNAYEAAVKQVSTLTVSAVPTVGKTCIYKVTYKDNLSIIPNQMKQTIIALEANSVNTATTTTWAAAVAAEFNKQVNKYVVVTTSTNTVIFTAVTLTTASAYNGIDRPETIVFDVNYPENDGAHGTHAVAATTAPKLGQGDAAKIAWLEDQHQGRRGYSDRRMWNNTKKFRGDTDPTFTYDTIVLQSNLWAEGDMQGQRSNPVGCVIAAKVTTSAVILTDLNRVTAVTTVTIAPSA